MATERLPRTTTPGRFRTKEQSTNRWAIIGGITALVIACFVAGYAFGTRGKQLPDYPFASADAPGGDPHPMGADMNGPAPSLNDLLPGLEAKVAANPKDIDQRPLLAQTYNEVGQRENSVKTLRAIHKDAPDNTRVTILLATMLTDTNSPRDLRDAFALLDDAARRKPAVEVMARLYQGDIRAKLGGAKGARAIWRKELARLPGDDPRRQLYQTKLAEAAPAK